MDAAGHERADVALRPIVAFAIVLALLCVAAAFAVHALFFALARRASARDVPGHPLAVEHGPPPPPWLQASSALDRERAHERERAALESYGWIDREAGVVRVPIERAMELVLDEGLPVREERR